MKYEENIEKHHCITDINIYYSEAERKKDFYLNDNIIHFDKNLSKTKQDKKKLFKTVVNPKAQSIKQQKKLTIIAMLFIVSACTLYLFLSSNNAKVMDIRNSIKEKFSNAKNTVQQFFKNKWNRLVGNKSIPNELIEEIDTSKLEEASTTQDTIEEVKKSSTVLARVDTLVRDMQRNINSAVKDTIQILKIQINKAQNHIHTSIQDYKNTHEDVLENREAPLRRFVVRTVVLLKPWADRCVKFYVYTKEQFALYILMFKLNPEERMLLQNRQHTLKQKDEYIKYIERNIRIHKQLDNALALADEKCTKAESKISLLQDTLADKGLIGEQPEVASTFIKLKNAVKEKDSRFLSRVRNKFKNLSSLLKTKLIEKGFIKETREDKED